jgi:hypothetical protein
MAAVHHDPRTRPVPDDIREHARSLMRERGPRGAATALGVSRSALLAVCAGADVLPGTLALLRQARSSDNGGRAA